MPFVADVDGAVVVPEEVNDDGHATCRYCSGELRIRRSHERDGAFVARHFYHVNGDSDCTDGGESDIHRRLKSIVLSKVKHVYPYKEAGLEKKIGENVADVYTVLEEPSEKFGNGVVFEIQHKNDDKDVESVTANYLQEGFSVCWIETGAVEGMDVDLLEQNWYYYSRVAYYLHLNFDPISRDETWSFHDPRPDCDHEWHGHHDPEVRTDAHCMSCGTTKLTHKMSGHTLYQRLGAR